MTRLLACLCLVLAGCDSSSGDYIDGDVRGTVVDAQTGQPLADASVRFAWEHPPEPGQVLSSSSADEEGEYLNRFRALGTCDERGDLTLQAEAPGYEPSSAVRVPCLDDVVEGVYDFGLRAAGESGRES